MHCLNCPELHWSCCSNCCERPFVLWTSSVQLQCTTVVNIECAGTRLMLTLAHRLPWTPTGQLCRLKKSFSNKSRITKITRITKMKKSWFNKPDMNCCFTRYTNPMDSAHYYPAQVGGRHFQCLWLLDFNHSSSFIHPNTDCKDYFQTFECTTKTVSVFQKAIDFFTDPNHNSRDVEAEFQGAEGGAPPGYATLQPRSDPSHKFAYFSR